MTADYFVVGPTIALSGCIAPGSELALRVSTGRPKLSAWISTVVEASRIKLQLSGDELPPAMQVEALRLFARLADRLSPGNLPVFVGADSFAERAEDLLHDGFVPSNRGWLRGRGPFLRKQRTDSFEGVYLDAFTVPWNFVPREVECLQPIVDFASTAKRTQSVLDLGFGFGKNATWLEDQALDVHGVEISSTATDRARQLVRHPRRFHNASATNLPFADCSFDAVLDVGCLHCIPARERPAAAKEICRVLRPGGFVSSRVFRPRDRAWVQRQPFEVDSFGLSDADIIKIFDPLLNMRIWRDHPDMIYLCGTRNDT